VDEPEEEREDHGRDSEERERHGHASSVTQRKIITKRGPGAVEVARTLR
jgi:hypothetical protein